MLNLENYKVCSDVLNTRKASPKLADLHDCGFAAAVVLPGVVLMVVVSGVMVVVCDTGRAFEGCPISKFNPIFTVILARFSKMDSNTNIINLIITKQGETQHLLEHRDWVTEISSMAMSPCNPFPRIPSMTNYGQKKSVYSLYN